MYRVSICDRHTENLQFFHNPDPSKARNLNLKKFMRTPKISRVTSGFSAQDPYLITVYLKSKCLR